MLRVIGIMIAALIILAVVEKSSSGKSTLSVSTVLSGFEKIGEGTYNAIRGWTKK